MMIKKRKSFTPRRKQDRYCIILNNNYNEAEAYCYSLGYRWMDESHRPFTQSEQCLFIYPNERGQRSSMTYSDRTANDYAEIFGEECENTKFVTLEQLKNILGE